MSWNFIQTYSGRFEGYLSALQVCKDMVFHRLLRLIEIIFCRIYLENFMLPQNVQKCFMPPIFLLIVFIPLKIITLLVPRIIND